MLLRGLGSVVGIVADSDGAFSKWHDAESGDYDGLEK